MHTLPPRVKDSCAPHSHDIYTCISQEAFTLEAMFYFTSLNLFRGQLFFVPMVKKRIIKCPCQGNKGVFVLFYLWGRVLLFFSIEKIFLHSNRSLKKQKIYSYGSALDI